MKWTISLLLLSILILAGCASSELPPEPNSPSATGNYYKAIGDWATEPNAFSLGHEDTIVCSDKQTVNISFVVDGDDFVYRHLYMWDDSYKQWSKLDFSEGNFVGLSNWIRGDAMYTSFVSCNDILQLADENNEVFSIAYSCSFVQGSWDCNNNKWQLQVFSVKEKPVEFCVDSDGGVNSAVKGYVNTTSPALGNITEDICVDAISLRELYCDDHSITSQLIDCEFGCNNGTCLILDAPKDPVVLLHEDTFDTKVQISIDGLNYRYVSKFDFAEAQGLNGVTWGDISPSPGSFILPSRWDLIQKALDENDRKLQLNIMPNNNWAFTVDKNNLRRDPSDGQFHPGLVSIKDSYHDDWGQFITKITKETDAKYIQIGSESENEWTNTDGFIEVLCLAHDAIKEVDPSITVMATGINFGELFSIPNLNQTLTELLNWKKEFAKEIIDTPECYDVFTLHLNRNHDTIEPIVNWVRNEMVQSGNSKPIWADDFYSGRWLPSEVGMTQEDIMIYKELQNDNTVNWNSIHSEEMFKKLVVAGAAGVSHVFLSTDVNWPGYYVPMWRHGGLLTEHGEEKLVYTELIDFIETVGSINSVTKVDSNTYIVNGTKHTVTVDWENGFDII